MRAWLLIAILAGCGKNDQVPPPPDAAPRAPRAPRAQPDVPTPVEAAKAAFGRICDEGDTKACLGANRPDDACLHGSAKGCMVMAERAPTLAAIYRGRACRRGLSTACESDQRTPRVTGRGLGAYEHAVADCWVETESVNHNREARGTLAITTDIDGRTTAIARITPDELRRCIEQSASRWVLSASSNDIDLIIRPGHQFDRYATLGVIGGGGGGTAGLGVGLGGLSDPLGGLGGLGTNRPRGSRVDVTVDQVGGYPTAHIDIRSKLRTRYSYMLKSCHRRELTSDPGLDATVRVRFTLTPSGRIDDIAASSTGPDSLRRCIKRRARIWRFEPAKNSNGRPESARISASIRLRPS